MLPKLTWPPTAIQDLDRTLNETPTDYGGFSKWDGRHFKPIRDDELEDLVSKIEREEFAHV